MTTAGVNITKQNIVDAMESVRNSYNTGIVWGTNSNPFSQTDYTGGSTDGYATQSFAGDISDANVTASTIVSNFRGYATLLSRIRLVRLLKWYQVQGNPRSNLNYDNTQLTNMNSNYQWNADGGFGAGETINASNLDSFVNYLSTNINNYRNSTVTVEEFYCHSNCHGSCHGSI
jgi:hypothetical protein